MKYVDLPNALRTLDDAFVNDPFHRYLRDTPDYNGGSLYHTAKQAENAIICNYYVASSGAWTVESGAAVVVYSPAKSTDSRVDKAVHYVLGGALSQGARLTLTKEQLKRDEELQAKHKAALEQVLGNRQDEVFNLRILAVSPTKQGQGYGSALARTVTGIADAQRRATVLISSNPMNTGFYNSLGFIEKGQIILGDDSSTWQDPPVVLLVMVREPAEYR